jgi:hypothetical protein
MSGYLDRNRMLPFDDDDDDRGNNETMRKKKGKMRCPPASHDQICMDPV